MYILEKFDVVRKIKVESQEEKYYVKSDDSEGLSKYTNKNEECERKIKISLTSYPARINQIHLTIETLLNQSKKVDQILLWLSKNQFPNLENDLPEELLAQLDQGFEIRWVDDDLKPHKKYYYVMKEYPNDIIITVDDDLLYEEDMVEKLYQSYLKFPKAVSTMLTHLITITEDGQKVEPYNYWIKNYDMILGKPSMKLLALSGSGTLYPPKSMHEQLFNLEVIKSNIPIADDLWLKLMQVMNNTPVALVSKYSKEVLNIRRDSQEKVLWRENVLERKNDIQLAEVLKIYNEYFGEENTLISKISDNVF
ncbi:MAG: hypothetical protein FWG67_03295 [Defluviitaleaceae bacterium]|nr:hypothetical protein [Defluviitaleaceae bacterium]